MGNSSPPELLKFRSESSVTVVACSWVIRSVGIGQLQRRSPCCSKAFAQGCAQETAGGIYPRPMRRQARNTRAPGKYRTQHPDYDGPSTRRAASSAMLQAAWRPTEIARVPFINSHHRSRGSCVVWAICGPTDSLTGNRIEIIFSSLEELLSRATRSRQRNRGGTVIVVIYGRPASEKRRS